MVQELKAPGHKWPPNQFSLTATRADKSGSNEMLGSFTPFSPLPYINERSEMFSKVLLFKDFVKDNFLKTSFITKTIILYRFSIPTLLSYQTEKFWQALYEMQRDFLS